MDEKNTKIISLEVENVKKIKALRITPDGNLVVLGGMNEQGKSTVLDSIEYVLRGSKSLPSEPLRQGTKSGYIVAETENLCIKRTFTEAGNSNLKVTNRKNGLELSSPQAILNELVGTLSFDPLDFTKMDAKKQKFTLVELAGLDLEEMEREKKASFDERTMIGREVKNLQGELAGLSLNENAPAEVVSVIELSDELQKRQAVTAQFESDSDKLSDVADQFSATAEQINDLKNQLVIAEKQKVALEEEGEKLQVLIKAYVKPNIEAITIQRDNAENINQQVRDNAKHQGVKAKLDQREKEYAVKTSEIAQYEGNVKEAIEQAEMPIEGLSLTDDGVNYNGVPFNQCSQAEQLKVSVAMGLALNPELKILLVREGALLDENSLGIVADMAKAHDAQIWLERVGEGEEVSVILEDGEIKSV